MRCETVELNVNYAKAGAAHAGEKPRMLTYLLENSPELPALAKRPAVIVCPGGGYFFKSDREAEPVALRFLAAGMHAFVLQYSVAPARYPCAALELAAAVQYVRENAQALGVEENHIFIIGFSAGGHLCATLGTLWNQPVFSQALEHGHGANWRPDGMMLCYPVITLGRFTHEGSRDNLLGENAPAEQTAALSLETRVSADTVPTFLWHTVADDAVPVENSLLFATALRQSGVPFEMHLYENGVHGLSLCDATTAQGPQHIVPDNAGWMSLALNWLRRRCEADR